MISKSHRETLDIEIRDIKTTDSSQEDRILDLLSNIMCDCKGEAKGLIKALESIS